MIYIVEMSGNLNLPAKATGVLCLTLGSLFMTLWFTKCISFCMQKYNGGHMESITSILIVQLISLLAGGATLIFVGAHEITV